MCAACGRPPAARRLAAYDMISRAYGFEQKMKSTVDYKRKENQIAPGIKDIYQ